MLLSIKITITVVLILSPPYRWFFAKIITMNTRNLVTSSYHSKIRSTQNKGVTFLFCLWYGLSVISSCKRATRNVSRQGRFRGIRALRQTFVKNTRKKGPAGKDLEFFLQNTVETSFRMKSLI